MDCSSKTILHQKGDTKSEGRRGHPPRSGLLVRPGLQCGEGEPDMHSRSKAKIRTPPSANPPWPQGSRLLVLGRGLARDTLPGCPHRPCRMPAIKPVDGK